MKPREYSGPIGMRKKEVLVLSTAERANDDKYGRVVEWFFDPDTFELLWYTDPCIVPRWRASMLSRDVKKWMQAVGMLEAAMDEEMEEAFDLEEALWGLS